MTGPLSRLLALLSLLAVAPAAEPVSTPDPRTAACLTLEEARAIVARQETLPTASQQLASAETWLSSVGVPDDAVQRLLAEARALEPLGAADEIWLLEFLSRTQSPEWLAIRGRFREFLDLPALASPAGDVVDALLCPGVTVSLPAVTSLEPSEPWVRAGGRLALPGITSLTPAAAAALVRSTIWLDLRGLESLEPAVAAALAGQREGGLSLGGMTALPEPIAAILAGHAGHLSLRGVTSLEDGAATALAGKAEGDLFLTGLREVRSPALATRLARQAEVSLPLADTLAPAAAKALAEADGTTDQRRTLLVSGRALSDPAVAEAIAAFRGRQLFVCGDFGLDAATARRLAAFSCQRLCLRGLKRLEPGAARELAVFPRELRLPRLADLSPEAAAALAAHQGTLDLPGLNTLSPDVIAALMQHQARLDLRRFTALTPQVARALATRNGDLVLPAVTAIDVEVAAALATHRAGVLSLPAIRLLPEDVAAALADHQGKTLHLSGLMRLESLTLARRFASQEKCQLQSLAELTPAVAQVLATRPKDLVLPGVRQLSREVAAALAAHDGVLSLPALQELDVEVAGELAKHRGGGLGLHGLRTIDPLAATVLVRHDEPIDLAGLMLTDRLDMPEVAELLVAKMPHVTLPNMTRFDFPESRKVAGALAKTRGRLSLPGLKAVSPATLTALLQKQDADVPEIESLELLPEPDGSATDDFVDPRPEEVIRRRQLRPR